MSFSKRLKAVLKEERYTQKRFSEETGIPIGSLERYIYGTSEAPSSVLAKISLHERFRKYTMWLVSGEVEENSGQVCPAFSTQEQCGLIDGESRKQA